MLLSGQSNTSLDNITRLDISFAPQLHSEVICAPGG